MPSFPDSVFAPANRSNGQVIDASHVNGVQDEIVAIEGGYINGTARLNSSALNVTAGSTFAVRPITPPPDAVALNLASTKAVTDGAFSTAAWAAGDHAINSSMFSGANSSRVTPQSTGVYLASAQLAFSANSSGGRTMRIVDSSGAVVGRTSVRPVGPDGSGEPTILSLTVTKRFDVTGGWLKVQGYQNGGSTVSLVVTDAHFSVIKL